MNFIITICILALLSIQPVEKPVMSPATFDDDLFKRELQNSVLEFCEDAGIDPDSVYMPFKDEL